MNIFRIFKKHFVILVLSKFVAGLKCLNRHRSKKNMSDQALLLPKWFTLAKGHFDHSYTFWTLSILIFNPVTNFGQQSIHTKLSNNLNWIVLFLVFWNLGNYLILLTFTLDNLSDAKQVQFFGGGGIKSSRIFHGLFWHINLYTFVQILGCNVLRWWNLAKILSHFRRQQYIRSYKCRSKVSWPKIGKIRQRKLLSMSKSSWLFHEIEDPLKKWPSFFWFFTWYWKARKITLDWQYNLQISFTDLC